MAETVVFCNSPWSERLPGELLIKIAELLNDSSSTTGITLVDTLRLRSVCKTWRSSIRTFKQTPSLSLTLPYPIAPNPALNPNLRRCFSVSQSTIYFVQPPQPHDPSNNNNNNINTTLSLNLSKSDDASNSKGCRSCGWLLRVEEREDGKRYPLPPLSTTIVQEVHNSKRDNYWDPLLPLIPRVTKDASLGLVRIDCSPREFPKSLNWLHLRISEIGKVYGLRYFGDWRDTTRPEPESLCVGKVVMSSSSDPVVMAIHGGKLWSLMLRENNRWSPIGGPIESQCDDVVYHKGKFYAVDDQGRAVVIGSDLNAEEIASPLADGGSGMPKRLVKLRDDLLLIDKDFNDDPLIDSDEICPCPASAYPSGGGLPHVIFGFDPHLPIHFKVFKLNKENREWERVESVEDVALFLGYGCSYSVSARDFPSALKGNCIYFLEDMFIGSVEPTDNAELCIYSLEDDICGPIEQFPLHWPIIGPPPAWLNPETT